MYCPSCGKSIPDESKFCLHCGKPTASSPKLLFSDLPPKHMAKVGWARGVPTVKNPFGTVSTGLRFWFQLLDNSLKPTRSSGNVIIQICQKQVHTFGGPTDKILYRATFNIQNDDFCECELSAFRSFPEPGLLYKVQEAVLKDFNDPFLHIEIWFKTPDGQELYGTNRV
jgi:zinc-ribbon domain